MQYLTVDLDPAPLRPPRQPLPPLRPRPPTYLPQPAAGPPRPARPLRAVRPALLAGEDLDAPDQHIFRGAD